MPAPGAASSVRSPNADRDPGLDYLATTYNGVDPAEFPFRSEPGDYLVFLGRFHPEKGTHLAIDIAQRAGVRLKIAAIPQDDAYFREQVLPHIDGDRVQFLGALEKARARNELLAGALALVHMTTRPERFGMTLIEAMACGTPSARGAPWARFPKSSDDGVTGFLCDRGFATRLRRCRSSPALDRRACRAHVEAEFTVERMVDRYVAAYDAALALGLPPVPDDRKLAQRAHDWWDRPMGYTDIPPKPKSLHFS